MSALARLRGAASTDSTWLRPALVSSVIPLLFYFFSTRYYKVSTSRAMYLVDFGFLFYSSVLFFQFQKNHRLAAIPFVMLVVTIQWAAIQKYVLLGIWVRWGDISLIDEGFKVVPAGQQIALALVACLAGAILLFNSRVPALVHFAKVIAPVVVVAGLVLVAPRAVAAFLRSVSHIEYGNDPLYRSPFFAAGFDFLEGVQFRQRAREILERYPDGAISRLSTSKIEHARNVHIFLMESFVDPDSLGLDLPEHPIDPRMRKMFGGLTASPVFAGRSAQAEFELLCGTPAYDSLDPVTFNDLRGGVIDCLPSLLTASGFLTLASADISPNFFNAKQAWQSLGFTQTYFRSDYPTTDMDGRWVSADQHVAFNKQLIGPFLESKQPILNYMFIGTGHTPYELDPEKRPLVVETGSTDEVTRFANALYYNSRTITNYVNFLLEVDEDAIIVVAGDHQGVLPSIGWTHAGSDVHELERYWTPYLFLDAGTPRSFGEIAHFDLTHLILDSLLGNTPTPLSRTHETDMIRPFDDYAFYTSGGAVHRCPDADDPRCEAVDQFRVETIARWLRLIETSRP